MKVTKVFDPKTSGLNNVYNKDETTYVSKALSTVIFDMSSFQIEPEPSRGRDFVLLIKFYTIVFQ